MLDFLLISTRVPKKGIVEIFPKFIIKKSNDLMIRGGDFYAIWDESRGYWSTDEQDALRMIDESLDIYLKEHSEQYNDIAIVKVLHMWDADSGMIDKWHKYCQKQMRDSFHTLDEKLIFANSNVKKRDYASKSLPYPLEARDTPAYDELIGTLYSDEERTKIEWAIGSIIEGDSKHIQKFIVLYGAAGTGKSTILNVIQQLFEGYYSVFDAKALGSSSNSFALEAFKSNPLVAIQHDGDLSRIEDNTRLNSLVSHEMMTVNEKFKSTYSNKFNSFLFMGTNRPVQITDAKSGLLRRLIDVTPTGNKVSPSRYFKLLNQIPFELGGIACHCRDVYQANPGRYDNYVPLAMMGASNDFYNFVSDYYPIFKRDDQTTAKEAWEMWKIFKEEANVPYKMPQRVFKEELKNYFKEYHERYRMEDGTRVRSLYLGFRNSKFEDPELFNNSKDNDSNTIIFKKYKESKFDKLACDWPAQYANEKEAPISRWKNVTTTLKDLDSSKLHYVKVPKNHIVIDFDIPDKDGNKSFKKNLIEASKWPETYAELSKSEAGIHLHYIYDGDVSKLEKLYADHIEIKVFTGNSSLRRKYTKSNGKDVLTINSGLPLKGETKMPNVETIKSEAALRNLIIRNLKKDIHPGTKPSIDFIVKILDDAYESGLNYDVSDMKQQVSDFAKMSTHQAEYCKKQVDKMKFKSKSVEILESKKVPAPIVFYDVEVFPNLFLVNFKKQGNDRVTRLINPKPYDIEELLKFKLVGFNNRRYDNHMLYACLIGYSNEQIYETSQAIINGDRGAFFGEAYNLSYTDVYDFSSKKQSLKKFEIELGIHHQELGLPWNEPVPEEMWDKVAEYCDNDVIATEAVFNARKADWTARQILAELADMTVNDTTNSLTTRIIFGRNRNPQEQFNYRNMGELDDRDYFREDLMATGTDQEDRYVRFDESGRPVFPGYIFEQGKSTYRGEEVGEGGYVYSEPGMYSNVALLDIASMHPTSIVREELFGPEYTKRFNDILQARIAIKHKDFATARTMLNGALAGYLKDEGAAKDLAQALKIAINSVYGLTSAKFSNPFRDPKNKDNIVAKRGALFMINLKHAVQERGYKVAHIKTDSIKIPDADKNIIDFVVEFGKAYGYNFEHEATYDRICLVNDAVYVAKDISDGHWTATGTQFQVPYVFKTLFSHEPIEFGDLCETKSVTSSIYLADPDDEENRVFVGKIGRFCPIKEGCGGKVLQREKDGKYYAVTGSKGYLWKEAEVVETLGLEDEIDKAYYDRMVEDAVNDISKYGDFDWFVSD